MNDQMPNNERPPLGQTIFLGGLCILMGSIAFLVGVGVIPSGSAEWSASSALLGTAAGLTFIFAGFMVIIRDLGGAKNKGEIPASAPLALRLGESVLQIVLIALFATIGSVIAFGPFFAGGALPDLSRQMGSLGGAIFRIMNGAISIVLWYATIWLIISRWRKHTGKSPIDPGI